MNKGIFITFEGPEGSGKSTQLRLLAEWLKSRGVPVLVTGEPGGSHLGKKLRHLLLHSRVKPCSEAELFLFLADRADHVSAILRPALERGWVVLCDRYIDSTLAYQGGGRGLPMARLKRLNREATGGLRPDVTFLLDLPVETGLARAGKRSNGKVDRMEREELVFHRAVRSVFLRLAKQEPKRFRLLDGRRKPEALRAEIIETLSHRWKV